ncbi:sulfatase [Saccharicrinis sp. GN24d3]|uniref:sulfatase n=1 Tax=Saccharicrinis sp. GN24d3 TaxID=3458416 RepID=UPI0040352532
MLFIVADDLGYHDLSCMGSTYYETPNIDQIAGEGMVFTDGYAACQVCSPSRASLISGKFPARHGITDWIGAATGKTWSDAGYNTKLMPPEYNHRLSNEYITLPEALKEAGYKTFFAGKWHVGDKGSWPEDHGFDINIGGWDVGSPKGGFYAPWKNPNLPSGPDGESLTMRLAQETADFIEAHKDTSFLAYLSFYAVHAPIQTTHEKWSKYRDKAEEQGIADSGFEMEARLPIRNVQDNPIYAGLIETMDDAVGLVLNTLKELGLDENTIVIFTADNGGVASGDNFSTSNLPLRGGKGYQYEGGIREPYFIKVPGLTDGGLTCHSPVSAVDLYPTILDLAKVNLRPEEHSDGVSLLPLLKGETIPDRPLIWHYPHYGNQGGDPVSIIRLGHWKLIHYYETGLEELYNLKTDLGEQNDLAVQHPFQVKELHEQLFNYLHSVNAKFPEKDPNYNENKAKESKKYREETLLPNLEKQRLNFLSKDFNPDNDWWGSAVTND